MRMLNLRSSCPIGRAESAQCHNVDGRHSKQCWRPTAARNPKRWLICAAEPDPEAAMREAMKDPQMAAQMKQYEEAMKSPQVQAQAQEMASVMQDPEMQRKMAALREDPELKPMFEEMMKGGMPAMMKFMNDPKWLAKVGAKLGDVPQAATSQQPEITRQTPPPPNVPPEINTILDASKYGDLEAVEDFIAVGKDVNVADSEGRTPLHYAVAYKHKAVFDELVASGADHSKEDSQGNNPLHYASGYGRAEFVKDLIDAGAKGWKKNKSGHTPFDLVKMEKRNPINEDYELLKLLEVASSS